MKVSASELTRRMEAFKAASVQGGVKLTHQRLEIFREVASSLEHPDAELVFRAVQKRMPTVSLDTVYRTLWTLTELGVISALGPRHESVRFDANLDRHHHYVCTRCGLTRDFDSEPLDAIAIPESVKRLGSIVATHVEVRGICRRCVEQAGGPADRNPPQGKSTRRAR